VTVFYTTNKEDEMDNKKMTERDFGYEHAKNIDVDGPVDVDEMCGQSADVPSDDYNAMVGYGIENPDAREYWAGYNDYAKA
jgi:hypothetical protein